MTWQRFPNQEGAEQNSHYLRGFMDGGFLLHVGLDIPELPQNHKKMEPLGSEVEVGQTYIHPMVLDSSSMRESVQHRSVEQ